MIHILLVTRRRLFREALATVLFAEDDLKVEAVGGRVGEAVALAGAVRPDVIVVDIDLIVGGPAITAREPFEPLSDCAFWCWRTRTVRRRADGAGHPGAWLRRQGPPHRGGLLSRSGGCTRGSGSSTPTLAVAALSVPPNPLTGRERYALREAAAGVSGGEIAGRLHRSCGTIRDYLSSTIRKTGARNRAEAVRLAENHGRL